MARLGNNIPMHEFFVQIWIGQELHEKWVIEYNAVYAIRALLKEIKASMRSISRVVVQEKF